MQKPTDYDVIIEIFRQSKIDFNNANGNIQAGDAELIFSNTGKLLSCAEFEHEASDEMDGQLLEDLEEIQGRLVKLANQEISPPHHVVELKEIVKLVNKVLGED